MAVYSRGKDKTGKDVIIGPVTVKSVTTGTSKNGNNYAKLVVTSEEFNEDLGVEVSEDINILFVDRPTGKYPSYSATQLEKLKLKPGYTICVRYTSSMDEDGKIVNFGTRAYYGNSIIQMKESKKGPGCRVIFGPACVNEKDGKQTLSVPVKFGEKLANGSYNNYSVFVQMQQKDFAEEDGPAAPEVLADFEVPQGEHKKVVAFLCDYWDYDEEEQDGKVTAVKAAFKSYFTI